MPATRRVASRRANLKNRLEGKCSRCLVVADDDDYGGSLACYTREIYENRLDRWKVLNLDTRQRRLLKERGSGGQETRKTRLSALTWREKNEEKFYFWRVVADFYEFWRRRRRRCSSNPVRKKRSSQSRRRWVRSEPTRREHVLSEKMSSRSVKKQLRQNFILFALNNKSWRFLNDFKDF